MTERTKTSVRLDADVVEIIASYAHAFTNGDKTKALNELVRATQSAQVAQATPEPPNNSPATQSHPEPLNNDLLDKAVLEIEELKTRISEIEQRMDKNQVDAIATHPATLEVGDMIAKSHPLHNTLMNSDYVEQECKKERKKYKVRWYQSLGLIVVAQERYDKPIFDVLAKVDPGSPITIGDNGEFLYGKGL